MNPDMKGGCRAPLAQTFHENRPSDRTRSLPKTVRRGALPPHYFATGMQRTVTLDTLREWGACAAYQPQLDAFAAEWPNGAKITTKNVLRAMELGIDYCHIWCLTARLFYPHLELLRPKCFWRLRPVGWRRGFWNTLLYPVTYVKSWLVAPPIVWALERAYSIWMKRNTQRQRTRYYASNF